MLLFDLIVLPGHKLKLSPFIVPAQIPGAVEIIMEELLEILNDLHPDVDFETCDSLIDDKILDSFDIVTIIAEVNDRLPLFSFR